MCSPFHVHAASCFQPFFQDHSQTQPNTLFTPICIRCTRPLHPALFLRRHPFHAPFTPVHPPRSPNPPPSPPPPRARPLLSQPPPPHRLPAHSLNLCRHHQNTRFLEPPQKTRLPLPRPHYALKTPPSSLSPPSTLRNTLPGHGPPQPLLAQSF